MMRILIVLMKNMKFKVINLILSSIIILFLCGCSYVIRPQDSDWHIATKVDSKTQLPKAWSEPIVGIWQINQAGNTWFQLAIIPIENQEIYQFKGMISHVGSLFDKDAELGEIVLYLSKVEPSSESHIFWGIWKDYASYSKNWTAIRFEANKNQGIIKENSNFYEASKLEKQNASSFKPITNSALQNTKPPSTSSATHSGSSSGYREISKKTGRAKTVHVRGYHRKDGTYVKPHYRSPPRRK